MEKVKTSAKDLRKFITHYFNLRQEMLGKYYIAGLDGSKISRELGRHDASFIEKLIKLI